MLFRFLWIGGTRTEPYQAIEEEYLRRLERFVQVEVVVSPEASKKSRHAVEAAMNREESEVRKRLHQGTFLIALDPRGKSLSSEEFADRLNKLLVGGVSEVTFLVGGYLGIPEGIARSADLRLSLSQFTFPHELARAVLLEQVYRGLTIVRGLPYHK